MLTSLKSSRPKLTIEINDNHNAAGTYTSLDRCDGRVVISTEVDVIIDVVEILFEGISTTTTSGKSVSHRFLKLRQPVDELDYQSSPVLRQGCAYTIPFVFVIPNKLLPRSCDHPKQNTGVEKYHVLLPPSLGDFSASNDVTPPPDDMSPEMVCISYRLKVSILKRLSTTSRHTGVLATTTRKIRVVPIVEEEPPLDICSYSEYYCTKKVIHVKGLFQRATTGRLIMEALQPKPIRLQPTSSCLSSTVCTTLALRLVFESVGDGPPLHLRDVCNKLKVLTFYCSKPWSDFPTSSPVSPSARADRGVDTVTLPLSTFPAKSISWVKATADTDINSSTFTDPPCQSTPTVYIASISVPVTFPGGKAFVPTFHSCLVSRVYHFDLTVSYYVSHTLRKESLQIPVQFTCGRDIETERDRKW